MRSIRPPWPPRNQPYPDLNSLSVETPTPQEPQETPALPLEPPLDPLEPLLEIARSPKRLTPAQEEEASRLLGDRLRKGKAGLASAIEPLLAFPWMVSVSAIIAAWPDLSLPMRRWLLASIARHDTEPARRLRLSLARAVFKIDPAAGLKLVATVAAHLRDPESGALSARNRQIFFNVLIGKGKPWLLQLPLADLKAADANLLIHGAIETFALCPPLSQLSILRWINEAGRLKKLPEGDLAIAVKAVSRWNLRLQRQLRHDIAELPEAIVAVLKPEPEPTAPEAAGEPPAPARSQPDAPANAEAEPDPEATEPPGEAPLPSGSPEAPDKPDEPETRAEEGSESGRERPGRDRRNRKEHPGRQAENERPKPAERDRRDERERPGRGEPRKAFDFKETLRGLDQYVASLRGELEQARAQVRRLEEGPRNKRDRRNPPEAAAAVDTAALQRHNAQLEHTIADLRQRLEDLATHHESVAESRNLHAGEPLEEGSRAQLVALLSIKLKEPFETYQAMRLDPLDRVFRLDYRDLLGSVFDLLIAEGVSLPGGK